MHYVYREGKSNKKKKKLEADFSWERVTDVPGPAPICHFMIFSLFFPFSFQSLLIFSFMLSEAGGFPSSATLRPSGES